MSKRLWKGLLLERLRRPVSLFTFSALVSIGTLLLYNIPFFSYVADNSNEDAWGRVVLQASLVVIMLVLNFMMTYLVMFLLRKVGRVLLALLALINATAVYFILTYHVMMDATTIGNVFNTRYSEASGFFSASLWLFILVFGVLPALYCLFQPVVYGKARRMGICCAGSLAVVLVVALANVSQTLWVGQHDTELGGLLQPWSYLVNTVRLTTDRMDQQAEEIKLPDGKIADSQKAVVVLVIGESARKANFQLYGYQRDTNPLLSRLQGLKVFQATSCATYTTAGSKAILPIHIDEYLSEADLADIYPDADDRYDGILLEGLRERIASSPKSKVLIVLHTSTSHGPNYADKYPQTFEVYKPVARNVEEGEKHVDRLVNAYDNTIRYTDYLLDSLVSTLRSMTDWHSAMMFISDHGESLGENNIFMHGLPMKLAPKVQYEIPFLVWTSDGFRRYKAGLPPVLEQHYVFHSVLNLLSIQSPAYDESFDIFER